VTSEKGFDVRKRDGCSLIDYYKIRVTYLICVIWEDKLHKLCMSFEYVNSQGCSLVLFIAAVNSFEVLPFFEIEEF
jgi:hypothetical protein